MMFAPKVEDKRPPMVDAYGYAANGYYYGHYPPARSHYKDPQYRVDNRYHRSDPRNDPRFDPSKQASTKDKLLDLFRW